MVQLNLEPNITDVDGFYAELLAAHDGLTKDQSDAFHARLVLILRGRRIGFTLHEIQDMLDMYDRKDGNVHQMAVALRRHRAQIETLKKQREDLDAAIETAEAACEAMEVRLAANRPDLLPGADDYASVIGAHLGTDESSHPDAKPARHPFKMRA